MKGIIAIVRTICMTTTAMVWIIIHIVVLGYIVNVLNLSNYSTIACSIAFPISALSGVGYIIYRWIKAFR